MTRRIIQSTCRRHVAAGSTTLQHVPFSFGLLPSPPAVHASSPVQTNLILTSRFLSTHGRESVGRLRKALEEYRVKNYTQTIPPRFRKEITGCMRKCASLPTSVDDQKRVAVQEIERLLQNIGALGDRVSSQDVETIVSELGESSIRAEEDIRADEIVTKLL